MHNNHKEEMSQAVRTDDYTEDEGPYWGEGEHMGARKSRLNGFWRLVLFLIVACPLFYTFVVVIPNMESIYRPVPDLVKVKILDDEHIPNHGSRLILIGDIHGSYKPFKKLLKKIDFQKDKDHVLVLGDFITKGPRSMDVLNYLMAINASCVRGNHENGMLLRYASYHHLPHPKVEGSGEKLVDDGMNDNMDYGMDYGMDDDKDDDKDDDDQDGAAVNKKKSSFDESDKEVLARHLTPAQVAYIGACPAIMDLGRITPDNMRAVAVHGGLAWYEHDLHKQDPNLVMEVRSFLPPKYEKWSEEDDGMHWSELWNEEQTKLDDQKKRVVFYAHDARSGLNIKEYTKGLDSGCVAGGELSAYVISTGKDDLYRHHLVSVKC